MATLEQLVGMGFPEEDVKDALQAHGSAALEVLLGGAPPVRSNVISAPISQYDIENGRSACTCICLEATMSILGAFGDGVWAGTSEDVANYVTVGVSVYEGVAAAGTLAVEHTSVAELLATVARFRDALQPATAAATHQGLLGPTSIANTLREIGSARLERNRAVAVAITKPPETRAFQQPRAPDSGLLFDSHPRPQLGLAGASVRSFAGEDSLVEALNVTFPAIDLGTDNVMASMYNMFDCVPLSMKHTVER